MERSVAADIERSNENDAWIQALSGGGPEGEEASTRLYRLLLRTAQYEARRQARHLRLSGPEVDDVAHQAAGDALLAVTRKISTFRGESRFTTWAYRFVIFDVGTKVNRHFWWRHELLYNEVGSYLVDDNATPAESAEFSDLIEAIRCAVWTQLTERQRWVLVATVFHGESVDKVAEDLGVSRNALYKTIHDARKKLRSALVAEGYLPVPPSSL